MNYYRARQRADGSGWAWTTMNDGHVRASDSCVTWPEGPPADVAEALAGIKPIGPDHVHATREEAERCYFEWEATNLRELTWKDAQHPCQYPGCDIWTQKAVEAPHSTKIADLCDDHRNADGWKAVHPFVPGLEIASSY